MDISEKLMHEMATHPVFSFKLFGFEVKVMDSVVTMWVVMAIILILAFILTRGLKMVPQGKQNVAEIIVEMINNLVKDAVGHHWRHFAPYLGTVLLFLAVANTVSLFNIIPSGEQLAEMFHNESFKHFPFQGLKPPTKDVTVTGTLAIMSVLLILFAGIRFKKLKGWLKGFIEPIPMMLPFKILEYGIIPLSLCFRLFGNILGAFIIMEFVYFVIPPLLPAALSIYFDIFDGLLQAYVFVFLTSLYVGEAVE